MFFFPILPVSDLAYFYCSDDFTAKSSLVLKPETLDFKNLGFVALGNIIDNSFNNDCFVQTDSLTPIKNYGTMKPISFLQNRSNFFTFIVKQGLRIPLTTSNFQLDHLNKRILRSSAHYKASLFTISSLLFKRHSEFLARTNEEIPTEMPLMYNEINTNGFKLNVSENFSYSDTLNNCFKYFYEDGTSNKIPSTRTFIVKCLGKNNYIFDMAKGKLYFKEDGIITLLGFFAVKSENIDYVIKCIKTGAIIHKDALAFVVDEKVFSSKDSYVRNSIKILEKQTGISIIGLNFEEFKSKISLPKVLGKQKLILDNFLEKVCEKFVPENNELPFYLID